MLTGNAVVDGAVFGIGVGVVGPLLVGKLLEDQNKKCHYRYKRDSPSARLITDMKIVFYLMMNFVSDFFQIIVHHHQLMKAAKNQILKTEFRHIINYSG